MVSSGAHGTRCCGAASLQGFSPAEENNPDLINNILRNVAQGRLVDITLNGNQVARPATMQRLADLGFVLDAHWINSVHDSHIYRFTRCDSRRGLLDGPIAGRWNGMLMTAGLNGDLPHVPGQAVPGQAGFNYAPYIFPLPPGAIADAHNRAIAIQTHIPPRNVIGNRYRIVSPRSRYHGQTFDLVRRGLNGVYGRNGDLYFNHPVTGLFNISENNCVFIEERDEPENHQTRNFRVGDRIQIARSWSAAYPVGLVGTVVGINHNRTPGKVNIRFDDPREDLVESKPEYIHLVDYEQQPDFPRERIVIPAPALPPPPAQRHADDGALVVAAVPDVAPELARVVFSTFHCVFADGRRGAGYDTLEEAVAALGRRRRVDRRDIRSNGDLAWVENINA